VSRRRFWSVPTTILETMLRMRVLRSSHVEARGELIARQIAADVAAETQVAGPWAVCPPEGMC
jgi:hypothetical protein